jgi:protocatechuate 3,4-dioxygenase alpha subunit
VGARLPVRHRVARAGGDTVRGLTPSQTVGPFFEYALPYEGGERLVAPGDPDAIRIVGAVIDGAGEPVDDALIEIWQANRHGRYAHPEDTREELPLEDGFTGFGRCPTDAEGRFEFVTVKPGAADGQAPHISVCVLARGLLRHLCTRIYFPDEAEANAADPLLASIADESLRRTLVARTLDGVLAFDIHLQGSRQTAFLDV